MFLPDGTKTTLYEVWDRYLVPFELDSDGFDIDWSGQLPDESELLDAFKLAALDSGFDLPTIGAIADR